MTLPCLLTCWLAIMLRKTATNKYLLAFNASAKARPNFGLPNVGYWSTDIYHKASHNFLVMGVVAFPCISFVAYMNSGVLPLIDEWCGGGPQHITPKQIGINLHADKPWEFRFGIGEGFRGGEAKYKKAPGAVDLHHS
jgi:hypothetical protein